MPPPAVYVLAVVTTVGAAVVFKHFVYDPHLSHVVQRWKEELIRWRRRAVRVEDDSDDSGDEPTVPVATTSSLSRWQQEDDLAPSSIELVNLVSQERNEWGTNLRQRNPHSLPFPSPNLLHVPSLSQSYPQELEVENGLELLSPPSSRAESPFSFANISPRPGLQQSPGSRVLTSSPAVLSDIGFVESPVVGPRQLALRAAIAAGDYTNRPIPGIVLAPSPSNTQSVPSSTRSTAYLSFSGSDSDEDEDMPLANRRASLLSPISGLGLTFITPTSPENLPAPLNPALLSPRSRLANGHHHHHPNLAGPLSDTGELSDLDLMSDFGGVPDGSELGELVSYPASLDGSDDRTRGGVEPLSSSLARLNMSDSQPVTAKESDLESDTSWSEVAGGSDFDEDGRNPPAAPEPVTPQLRPVVLGRDDTVKARKRL